MAAIKFKYVWMFVTAFPFTSILNFWVKMKRLKVKSKHLLTIVHCSYHTIPFSIWIIYELYYNWYLRPWSSSFQHRRRDSTDGRLSAFFIANPLTHPDHVWVFVSTFFFISANCTLILSGKLMMPFALISKLTAKIISLSTKSKKPSKVL